VKRTFTAFPVIALIGCLVWSGVGCSPSSEPQTGSQTNWLSRCETDADCGGLACLCGACTHPCTHDSACADIAGSTCVAADELGAVAQCDGQRPSETGLCLPRCATEGCAEGEACVGGVCQATGEPVVSVWIDQATRLQTLTGFGATLAYAESDLIAHPQASSLYDVMFRELGLDILRLRNRYDSDNDDDLSSASEILRTATESLGRSPTVFLTSWTPPADQKANGAGSCTGNPETCTLRRTADGSFDYDAYATYWRESLEAYAAVGVVPDYVGLQNNPDYAPSETEFGEACRFLPTEGTVTVTTEDTETEVTYPGFAEAFAKVRTELSSLSSPPRLLAPETSDATRVAEYLPYLDPSAVAAVAHHMYGMEASTLDLGALGNLSQLARAWKRPLFQTEMLSGGLETATLMHYSLVEEQVSAYLHSVLLGPADGALIALGSEDFAIQDSYHAIRHYARYTDPGWVRAEARSSESGLLVSAWLSPLGNALTIVLVNSGAVERTTELDLGGFVPTSSSVVRTVFGGVERSAELGVLPDPPVVRLPVGSMVTVALSNLPSP
jgi:glucuronoarabinoxylan endo-1,4-beta-xylanase